jgi:hypothetical protein
VSEHSFAYLRGQRYISLATFRRNGQPVLTPVWFAEKDGNLYVMTRSDSGKYKRIRNNPQVRVAPCTSRGRVTGPDVAGGARVLPPAEEAGARQALARKYWLIRFPWLWSRKNVFLEIEPRATEE